MPAAVIVVAAAASGVAAYIGGAVVAGLALGTISAAAVTAIGVGVIAGGVTAIQGGSTSDILKSAVLSGIGSYVGGQVASKVTNSVSAATGVPAGTGLSAGAAGTTGLTAGSAGASGITAGAGAGATLGAGITPTTLGILAGNIAGQSTQAAITGQDIGEAALFGAATSIGPALNQSKDFRSLDKTTQNVIIASSQAAVMGQDIPEAALSALVQSSNIVAKAINEIPGGDKFIRDNPIYTRYIINAVSSALTAELLNKNVNDALIASLARTTGQVLSEQFTNAQKEKEVLQAQQVYQDLEEKERQLLMVQEQIKNLQATTKFYDRYSAASENLQSLYEQNVDAVKRANDAAKIYNNTKNELDKSFAKLAYDDALMRAETTGRNYNAAIENFRQLEENVRESGYFNKLAPLEKQFTSIQKEYENLGGSLSDIAFELSQSNADLFNETSRQTLEEIERFASLEEPEIDADAPQYAENSQGMRIDIAGVPRVIYETKDKSVRINDGLVMFLDEFGTGIYENAGTLTPEEFEELTGRTVYEALESSTPLQEPASVEDIAGIPSFTSTQQADLDALRFVVGVDLRKEASPQTNVGKAIYRPAGTTGTTGTGGTSSTFQIIGRDSATGAEKVNVDGKGFTLIALPGNKQALVKDDGEVIVYVEKDPVTNDTVLREEPNPEIVKEIVDSVGGGGGGATSDSATGDSESQAVIKVPESSAPPIPEAPEAVGTLTPAEAEAQLQAAIADELEKLEKELADAQFAQQETEKALQKAQEQSQKPTETPNVGIISPETETALNAEIRALENQLAQSAREAETAAADKDQIGALQQGASDLSDEDILSFLETGELPGGAGRPGGGTSAEGVSGAGGLGDPGVIGGDGGDQEGVDGGTGGGRGGGAGSGAGDGTGAGAGGGEGNLFPDTTIDQELPQAVVTLGPEFAERPTTTPFASRVTGEALEGILGEKQPLFGGDDDEQRAVWNRRSLRLLSRALGI